MSRVLGSHQGYIFDLDGTLVDSKLDFSALCRQLGWPQGTLILEHLATLPESEQQWAREQIHQFELAGAMQATLMPGVTDMLAEFAELGLPTAILTRNSKAVTELTLERFHLPFKLVLTRDDAPAKPDPTGLWRIAEHWRIAPADLLFIGDYLFDLETAKAAGMPSCLYLDGTNQHFSALADYQISHFVQLQQACRQWVQR